MAIMNCSPIKSEIVKNRVTEPGIHRRRYGSFCTPWEAAGNLSLPPARLLALSVFTARRPRSPFAKEITMRSAASALLLLGATACPASASATVIQAIASTWGCQFSATLSLFPEYSADSQEDFDRILDSGHCLVIDAHIQRLTVHPQSTLRVCSAPESMQQDDQWVVVFVRKSDFEQLPDGPCPSIRSRSTNRPSRILDHAGLLRFRRLPAPAPAHPPIRPRWTKVQSLSAREFQDAVGPH